MTVAVLSHFVMEPAGLPGSIHIHTDWDPNARYNKWEIDEGQSAYEDLGGLQEIFEDLPFDPVDSHRLRVSPDLWHPTLRLSFGYVRVLYPY